MQLTLFGRGGVQALDGRAHRVRKGLFMELMTRERVEELAAGFADRRRGLLLRDVAVVA